MKTPFIAAVLAVFRKDLRAETRSKELLSAMGLFGLLSILVFSFALELDRQARVEAISGVLWVTLIFASILGLNRSMAMERDQGNLDALLIAPIDRTAIFIGKLIGNTLFMLIVALVLLPVMTVLYNINLVQPLLIVVVLLGTLGFATVGTLLAAMTVQTRSRESLLPIVMLPVALPLILGSVRASTGILNATPFDQWGSWLGILAVLNAVFLGVCFVLFEFVIED